MTSQPLFTQLRTDAAPAWTRYTRHPFVLALGDGTLPREKFQAFLIQDYLFLVEYARAHMLLAYKLDTQADMRAAMATAAALLEDELPLHVSYCAGWGISEAEMQAAPASLELIAYTNYVLECGHRGDALDLMVALAPCIAGYGEIAAALAPVMSQANPYRPWIQTYTGPEYCTAALASLDLLNRLALARLSPARYPQLLKIFTQATLCEAAFWETGWR